MIEIEHDVAPIRQRTSECSQTAATQMLSFFDPDVRLEDVIAEVPVYVENGEKIGTSPGHLAAYLAQRGYETTAFIFDVELFDRSWRGCTAAEVLSGLRARQEHIPLHSWLSAYHHILVDGWQLFADSGGSFAFPPLSAELLVGLLADGPFVLMLNSTYLNQQAKQRYNEATDVFDDDPLRGRSLTHAVTCAGYRDGEFLLIDPDPPEGVDHRRWIDRDHLIASVMAAQTESDNMLLAVAGRRSDSRV